MRAYQPGDEEGIGALFETVYRRPFSRAQWHWKLRKHRMQTENEWVAEADGRIVGHYAVMPIRFQVQDHVMMVPHGCDAMTHPDFRRRGILTALGTRANAVWRAAGAPFQIGFHYGGWGSVRERLGWQPVLRVVWVKSILSPAAFLMRRLGVGHAHAADFADHWLARLGGVRSRAEDTSIRVTRVHAAGEEFADLWHQASDAYTLIAVRDRAWVQWRYLDMPGVEPRVLLARREHKPCGYLAYRIHRDARRAWAVILDCFTSPDDHAAMRTLLHYARRELARERMESVAALVIPNSPFHKEFRRAGFWQTGHGFDFSIIPYSNVAIGSKAGDWFVTGAEGDVV